MHILHLFQLLILEANFISLSFPSMFIYQANTIIKRTEESIAYVHVRR